MDSNERLIRHLVSLPRETPWLEFKHNRVVEDEIGEYISALGNSAACEDKDKAYLIYGVHDTTHEIVGTSFNPYSHKIGNEELENWLHKLLSNNANFEFSMHEIDGKNVVIFTIQKAVYRPLTFKKEAYIRSGSYKKHLRDVPVLENKLWSKLNLTAYEELSAVENLDLSSALTRLDYTAYFERTEIQQPLEPNNIAHYLIEDGILKPQDNGQYSITNLGALLFAKKLSEYPHISRKRLRIIQYNGNSRTASKNDITIENGYAASFDEVIRLIIGILPAKDEIVDGIRKNKPQYPEIIIRELLANALIHQDFTLKGVGPTVEIFDGWFEITNPGELLIDEMRIIDNPPKSRNEALAMLMRRCHICEEEGSGWDKIINAAEENLLPAPRFMTYPESTKVLVRGFVPLDKMSTDEKIWSCYLHACLKYSMNEMITNASLRERFGVSASSKASISRIIKTSIEKGLIKPFETNTAPRYMKYIPFWA